MVIEKRKKKAKIISTEKNMLFLHSNDESACHNVMKKPIYSNMVFSIKKLDLLFEDFCVLGRIVFQTKKRFLIIDIFLYVHIKYEYFIKNELLKLFFSID